VSIEGAGHSVAGDKPDEFVQVVDAFLGKVLARG
jgi:pimeloyl-ACP methyl ester carboxylesterase